MKDSGTGWIGEIPDYWDIGRIDGFYTLRNTKVSDTDYPPLSVTMKGILPQLETAAKTNAHDDRKLVKKGDFAINSRSDRRGSCGISEYDGSVSLINTILAPKGEMHPKYYDWLFHTVQFADEFYRWGHGIVDDLWTTNYQDMKKINIPILPMKEQILIADFLTACCADIDRLAEDIQSELDLLDAYKKSVITESVTYGLNKNTKMKKSGISWMPNYPENWKLSRLKYHGSLQNGISKGGEFFGEGYPFVSYGDVYKNITLPKEASGLIRSTLDERIRYSVEKGDAFFTRTSESIEEIGFSSVCEKTINDAVFAGFLIRFRPSSKMLNMRYAKYYFRSENLRLYYVTRMMLVTRASLSQQLLGDMPLLLPPLDEQERIADFLDRTCEVIDTLIAQKQEQYDILSDYKKSVIFEYVTGKKELPGA